MTTEQQKIGELIHTNRKKLKITLKELGKHIGVGQTAIYHYEKGDTKVIPFEKRVKLAEVLDIPIESLLYDIEAPKKTIYTDNPSISIKENKLVEFIAKAIYSQGVYKSMDEQLKSMFPASTEVRRRQMIDSTRNHILKILIDKSDSDNLRVIKEASSILGLNVQATSIDTDTKK